MTSHQWQPAIVLAQSQTQSGQQLKLGLLNASNCAKCESGVGCGAGLLSRLLRWKVTEIDMQTEQACRVGQKVWLGVDSSRLQKAALIGYGLPLTGFLVGLLAADLLVGSTAYQLLIAISGLLAGLVTVALIPLNWSFELNCAKQCPDGTDMQEKF